MNLRLISIVHAPAIALATVLVIDVAHCYAHPVPVARAGMALSDKNSYSITLTCDVAALVMQAQPGHLGDHLAEELREMPEDDLQLRVDEARKAFEQQFRLVVGGKEVAPHKIEFPDLATIRKGAQSHSTHQPPQVFIYGQLPTKTRSFTVRFPEDLGRVMFGFSIGSDLPQRQTLAPGAVSRPISLSATALQDSATEEHPANAGNGELVAYTIMGILAAFVAIIFIRAARRQSRALESGHDGESC